MEHVFFIIAAVALVAVARVSWIIISMFTQ